MNPLPNLTRLFTDSTSLFAEGQLLGDAVDPKSWGTIAAAIVSALAGFGVAAFTVFINSRNQRSQLERDAANRKEQQQREDAIRKEQQQREDAARTDERARIDHEKVLLRELEPHVEFTIDCRFLGPAKDQWLAEVSLVVKNLGQVIHRFSSIMIRVLGIKADQSLTRWDSNVESLEARGIAWKDRPHRAFFPDKIARETNIIPPARDGKTIHYFAEPGVKQVITYLTTIPTEYRFILIFAEFVYLCDDDRTHDCERVFEVPCHDGKDAKGLTSQSPSEVTIKLNCSTE